jgi:N-acetylglucosamine-6-phosphate deacetylase
MEFGGWSLQQALRLATKNPAAVVGAERKGILEAGADADLVALTENGEVRATFVRGEVVQG